MYKTRKLYLENYPSYCVRTNVLTKFICDLDLWTTKCIGIFLSSSCIYVRNMKAVRWKLLKLSCQSKSVDNIQLWPWPLTFLHQIVLYRYLPLTNGHPLSTYEIWKLHVEDYLSYRVRIKILTKLGFDLDLWPFDPKIHRYLPLNILHLYYEIWKLYVENYLS